MANKKDMKIGNLISNNYIFTAILFIVLFAAVISLFSGFVFSDKGLYGSDTVQAGMFFRGFYADYYAETGKVPVWNPYQFCGIPYIDGFHGDTFYPFSKLLLVINVFRAWGWNLLIHVFLAGITMFFCARTFGRSQLAAALSAVSYMFAAYFVSQVAPGHDGKMFVTALFPLTLMFIELAFERKPLVYFSLLGLTIGLIILTPHPQMAYYVLWVCAFYSVFKLVLKFIESKSVPALIKPSALFVWAVVLGLAISAIHFYPGYTYVKNYSPRADEKRGDEWAKSWSMHPEEAMSLLVPEFCGVNGEKGASYWGRNAFKDNSEYAGAVPLMVALIGVMMVRRKKTWFFAGLALFAFIYAMASNTWFFYLFYNLIPNVKSTRAWSMIMFIFSFSISLLAAFGMDFILENSRKLKSKDSRLFLLTVFGLPGIVLLGALFFSASAESAIGFYKSVFYNGMPAQKNFVLSSHLPAITAGFWKTFFFLIVPAALIWLYSKKKIAAVFLTGIVLFAFIDAYRFDKQFIKTYDPQTIFAKSPLVDYFKSLPGKYRVLDLSGRYLPTNYLPYFGIEEMTSYHGNQPRWFQKLIGGTPMRNMFNINLMNITNTKYVLITPGSPVRGNQLESVGFNLVHKYQSFQVYENPLANERAYIVHDWIVNSVDSLARRDVLTQGFDVNHSVVLEKSPEITPTKDTAVYTADTVNVETYENDYIRLTTTSQADGILILGDNWYPSWKAFIDGNEVKVYKANTSFRGVVLPAGKHTVEFKYVSSTYATGKMLTWAGLLLAIAGAIGGNFIPRKKRKNGVEE
ncbi:MAG: YfhO family protein [candidate division Zixibacteria bacterium]|nr:YfhO family protein [candidate division Zixibacteria bacterium]